MSWSPFNSVIGGGELIKELDYQRNKIDMPLLSEDQREKINTIVLFAYQTKREVLVRYYFKGFIHQKTGIILHIDKVKKELNINKTKIAFNRILLVNIIND